MHWGDAKRWYGVPAYATGAFEEAFQQWLPDQMALQPDLLFQLVTLLSPHKLRESGVPGDTRKPRSAKPRAPPEEILHVLT
jgi:histone demethylase JARID1